MSTATPTSPHAVDAIPHRPPTGREDAVWIAGRVLDLPDGPARRALHAGYYAHTTYRDMGGYDQPVHTEADAWLTAPEQVATLEAAEAEAARDADAQRIADAAARGVTLLPTVPGKVRGIVGHVVTNNPTRATITVQCDGCGTTSTGRGNLPILTSGIIFPAPGSDPRRLCRACRRAEGWPCQD